MINNHQDDAINYSYIKENPHSLSPKIDLYDPQILNDLIDEMGMTIQNEDGTMQVNHDRKQKHDFYINIKNHQLGHKREILVVNRDQLKKLETLEKTEIIFKELVGIIKRAALHSYNNSVPLKIPHILINGPAGIGKTHICRKIADILSSPTHYIDFSDLDDKGKLTGRGSNWKGMGPSVLGRALANSHTANHTLILDELDKASSNSTDEKNPLQILHQLLEPETAEQWTDNFIEIPFNASYVFFIGISNNIDSIPETIKDRFTIIDIKHDNMKTKAIHNETMTESIAKALGIPSKRLDREVIDYLSNETPRAKRKIIHLAIGFAALRNEEIPKIEDIKKASIIEGAVNKQRNPIGFFSNS